MDKKLLILGIDPGTTTAYAALDVKGDIVALRSSKLLNFSNLLFEVTKHGKVVVVAADTNPASEFVDKFSRVTGAKLIYPKENLKTIEKKRLTSDFKVKNVHENDALAAALFAFKKIRSLLRKIDSYLIIKDKINFADDIKYLLLTKEGMSITTALRMMEKPEKKITKEKKKKIVEIKPKVVGGLEKENLLLKEQNRILKIKLETLLEKEKYLTRRIRENNSDEKIKKILDFKEDRIRSLSKEIDNYQKEILRLKDEIESLNGFLSVLEGNILVRRFDSFSRNILNEDIKEGGILFVDNPDIISERVLEFLEEKMVIVITNKPVTNKMKRRLDFIDAKKVRIKESKKFVLVNKEDLDKERRKLDLLDKIIEEYKEKRKQETT